MNAVESLLSRLQLPGDVMQRARDKNIVKIMTLRNLSEGELRELVDGNEMNFQTLSNAINTNRTTVNQAQPMRTVAPAPLGRGPEDDIRGGDGFPRGRGGRGRGGAGYRGRSGADAPGDFIQNNRGGFRGGRGGYRGRGDGSDMMPRSASDGNGRYPSDGSGFGPRYGGSGSGMRPELSKNCAKDIEIPFDMVKWLLADHAKQLLAIHHKYNTSNSKIEKPTATCETLTVTVYGPTQEAVEGAAADIFVIVGVAGQQRKAARADYFVNELHCNEATVTAACVANTRNKACSSTTGDSATLSDAVMKRLVGTFLFEKPSEVKHFSTALASSDKEKVDQLVKCAEKLKGGQVIIFAEPDRVEELEKNNRFVRAFGKATPIVFIQPKLSKEERMVRLMTFKNGAVNDKGVRTRVLVTTNDYAKLARKIEIPFVNFVVHFTVPRSRENYLLQTGCVGRNGYPGVSLMFYQSAVDEMHTALSKDFALIDFTADVFGEAAEGLKYDTEAESLTPASVDPPENWRELLAKEKAEKEAAKTAKAAAKSA